MRTYDFVALEKKWQQTWERRKTFRTAGPGDHGFRPQAPKYYVLDMFPYPSGAGLHVGHPLGYFATDMVTRYKRMLGFNVLHPMGFDAFGLPAEQYAIETGVHPRITTEKNIATMRRQMLALGLGYDWEREVATIQPGYYRWTQWIFLQLFKSWFDPAVQAARPIAELEHRLAAGELKIDPEGAPTADPQGEDWSALEPASRRRVLDDQRLAYLAEVPVNWCPALGTVLANEEVTAEGRSERGNHPVFKRPLRQWMLRITRYAERLLADLDLVDWPEPIKLLQRNWIGRSEGAVTCFRAESGEEIEIFTTRPDTLFGATYLVLAPEHPLVDRVTTADRRAQVDQYRKEALARAEVDRLAESREKTGVFTGGRAVNPVNGESVPVWIADYVMMGYGTGAIMAVPAHDQRDFEFAHQAGLPLRAVVVPPDAWLLENAPGPAPLEELRARYLAAPGEFKAAFCGPGSGCHSANAGISLDGLPTPRAKQEITAWLEAGGLGRARVNYKLRDWLFSRQRYWGEPFPILIGPEGEVVPVAEEDLPVELPPMEDFRPPVGNDPERPPQPSLARAPESWRVVWRDGVRYERELNTMPQWAGSCWYYLRYLDPGNSARLVAPDRERYWMSPAGVDLYVGGVEHAVLHLLYARFWHKVLYDLGHVSTPEPFGRLCNQGYILAYSYQDSRGAYVPAEQVEERGGEYFFEGQKVQRSLGKMGKSLKNSVVPDDICREYGCDTLRLYEMAMGPLETSKPWNTRDIVGVHRFLQRVWRNFVDAETGALRLTEDAPDPETNRLLHFTVKVVTSDMERMSFNTAIARLIELNNRLVSLPALPRQAAETFLLLLAPLAPHIAEELWERLGHAECIALAAWPAYDPALLEEDSVEIVVQVRGKVRGHVTVPAGAGEDQVRDAVLADPGLSKVLAGSAVRKVIFVPGKLINLVTA